MLHAEHPNLHKVSVLADSAEPKDGLMAYQAHTDPTDLVGSMTRELGGDAEIYRSHIDDWRAHQPAVGVQLPAGRKLRPTLFSKAFDPPEMGRYRQTEVELYKEKWMRPEKLMQDKGRIQKKLWPDEEVISQAHASRRLKDAQQLERIRSEDPETVAVVHDRHLSTVQARPVHIEHAHARISKPQKSSPTNQAQEKGVLKHHPTTKQDDSAQVIRPALSTFRDETTRSEEIAQMHESESKKPRKWQWYHGEWMVNESAMCPHCKQWPLHERRT
ncbi:hypothetical protein IE81DRAFT_365499 [Ceraceosorus guamensis]|uniref:Uncharacterized protein n=1 Tax=Ceraceosorus guamensis TaxID=1522189 RepID=A0A316W2F9_9BASI|nr:hypothetical protein IE81DRAFT_365499 [Ceraceosorus guamensis]PWN43869.1 hypothetical protein IE81DRAFT_365499 [Ceraceosorus guamensis]